MNVYIDKNGNLFDGNTTNVNGMVKCELDTDGKPYKFYNLDGTPDTIKIKEYEDAVALEEWKKTREEAVKNILVTVPEVTHTVTHPEVPATYDTDGVTELTPLIPAWDEVIVDRPARVYQGDEVSQTRLARAITVMDDVEEILWVLADNTVVFANKAELTYVLKEAGKAQAMLWVK